MLSQEFALFMPPVGEFLTSVIMQAPNAVRLLRESTDTGNGGSTYKFSKSELSTGIALVSWAAVLTIGAIKSKR